MNRMIYPRRGFFASHYLADDDPTTGQSPNVGSTVAGTMVQRVLAGRTARCKKGG